MSVDSWQFCSEDVIAYVSTLLSEALVIRRVPLAAFLENATLCHTIPAEFRIITRDGNTVTLGCPSLSPHIFNFYVASVDGPRLRGELHPRFAALIQAPQ